MKLFLLAAASLFGFISLFDGNIKSSENNKDNFIRGQDSIKSRSRQHPFSLDSLLRDSKSLDKKFRSQHDSDKTTIITVPQNRKDNMPFYEPDTSIKYNMPIAPKKRKHETLKLR